MHSTCNLRVPLESTIEMDDIIFAKRGEMCVFYAPDVLDAILDGLDVFSSASGARIKWHKSLGFLSSKE